MTQNTCPSCGCLLTPSEQGYCDDCITNESKDEEDTSLIIATPRLVYDKTIEMLIQSFEQEQTPEKLNSILLCLDLKKMEGGKWVNVVSDIVFPIRFVRLYSKVGHKVILTGIGIY